MKRIAWILTVVMLLSGCNRLFYPETLEGNVTNGVYTTRVGNGARCKFRIWVPQSFNQYEVHYLCTKEHYANNYTFTSFGPWPTDDTIYRVMVVNKPKVPLDLFKLQYFPKMIDIAARGYDRHMTKIFDEPISFYGRPAWYEVYTQDMPSYYYYISRHQPEDKILTHAVYYVDYCDYYVIFWIETSSQSAVNSIDYRNRIEIINRTWVPAHRFLRSFVFV